MTRKVQEVLKIQTECGWEASFFVKLASPFKKTINQHFKGVATLILFVSGPWEFLGCMVVVEMPGS